MWKCLANTAAAGEPTVRLTYEDKVFRMKALLVIDMQVGLFEGDPPRYDADGVIQRVNRDRQEYPAQRAAP